MRTSMQILPVALLTLLGCTARNVDPGPADTLGDSPSLHEDGETGIGTFETLWGTAKLDYQWLDGRMIHDGDIVLDPKSEIEMPSADGPSGLAQAQQPLLRGGKKWDMVAGVVKVPYSFAADISDARRKQIRTAMDEWENEIGFIEFVESSTSTGRRVKFVTWEKNYCYVNGSPDDEGFVYTSGNCTWITYVHELGHVLGFKHEQKRTDRDTYVEYDKAKTCQPSEFSFSDGEKLGTYDTDSIMHYPSCLFANSTSLCGGSGGCSKSTPDKWVLTRKTAYGPAYIPSWGERSAGDVIRDGDKCNFKTLYGMPCKQEGGAGGTGGSGGSGGTGGSASGAGGTGGDAGNAGTGATGGVTGGSGGSAGSSAVSGGAAGSGGEPEATPAPEEPAAPDVAPSSGSSADSDGGCALKAPSSEHRSASWLASLVGIGLMLSRRRRF